MEIKHVDNCVKGAIFEKKQYQKHVALYVSCFALIIKP